MYLDLNSNVYDTETKRVIFMLSYMKGGTAQAWKESFLTTASESTPSTYGTIDQLITKLKTAFELADSEGDARAQIRKLRQGKNTVDEYIAQF